MSLYKAYSENPLNDPNEPTYKAPPLPFKDESTKYILLSFLEIIFCGGLFGIVPLVFAFQYKDAVVARDEAEAMRLKRKVRIALIGVLIFFAVSLAFSLVVFWQTGFFDYVTQQSQSAAA